ncbi:MAG: DUF4198 domain-containing protein [Planctomycetaceae bacterium]|nr:DUF4198 domain-containing protein [Planctomycetaceae bacterium]
MLRIWNRALAWPVAAGIPLVLAVAGCGASAPANVGRVSGQVTLAGQPLPDALVTFIPVKQGGSTALGKTDASGNYTLNYASGIDGAEIGPNRVSITTYAPANPDSDPPRAGVPEKVPAKYNLKTELTADVKAGNNTIDFSLEAGPVVQPGPEPE